jgi:DNA-binding beta-propeller fold protein YncE
LSFTRAILFLLLTLAAHAQDSVRTFAGRALQSGSQDGPAVEARFHDPAAIVSEASGNLYIADTRNNAIRRVTPNGSVTTITASNPPFDTPTGLAISPHGLIISDTGNHIIRRLNSDGSIITVAGAPRQSGSEDGPASNARFDSPLGLATSTNGTIYVADCGNHLIRAISPDGIVTTIAGSAKTWGSNDGPSSTARFNGPVALAIDSLGNIFVSDSNDHTIRKITPTGEVTTFAGYPLQSGATDGVTRAARFFHPAELAFDAHGALYIADSMNHAIRKISAGRVTTITGFQKSAGSEDGDNRRARLYNPYGLAFLPTGQLAITDAYNQTLRQALPPAELQVSTASLTWNAVMGRTYQLQIANSDLNTWLNIGQPIIANQLTIEAAIPSQNNVSLFRVLTLP